MEAELNHSRKVKKREILAREGITKEKVEKKRHLFSVNGSCTPPHHLPPFRKTR